VPAPEFAGPSGGTVLVRVPRPRIAHQQVTPGADVTFDIVTEDHIEVTLAHTYSATLVTDEDLSLALEDYGFQILMPAIVAIAEAAENSCATALLTAPDVGIQWPATPDPQDDLDVVLQIRERMTSEKIPATGRYCAVSPDVATRLLNIPEFVQASLRGDQGDALTSASIGTVFGVQFLETVTMPADTAVAFHQSGVCFANVAPRPPGGGADCAVAVDSGLQLRQLLQYAPHKLSTASIISVFSGASLIEDEGSTLRAFRVDTQAS
jgi:hypothetical protein